MSYYNYKSKKIYYEEIGDGNPLLLLHGNTASSKMFSDVVKLYSYDFKVILIDFLGHGQSDRLSKFAVDLWFDEAQQVITFLKEKEYKKVNIIGSSGGALAAINVALEVPELVEKVIADSFEGEVPLKAFTENITEQRELSKHDENARMFYYYMHGNDWEQIVDNDTRSIAEHNKSIGKFFHKPLESLKPDVLLTGSKADEFICSINPDFFEIEYGDLIRKIGHGEMFLFESGSHPAMLSNKNEFASVVKNFLSR